MKNQYNNSHSSTHKPYFSSRGARSVVAGLAFASASGLAQAAAPLIAEDEYITARQAVCQANAIRTDTASELKACDKFALARKNNLTDKEKAAVYRAVCEERHALEPAKEFEVGYCTTSLAIQYNKSKASPLDNTVKGPSQQASAPVPLPEVTVTGKAEKTNAEACADKVPVGLILLGHGACTVVDLLGAAGACNITLAKFTIPGALGACAYGARENALDNRANKARREIAEAEQRAREEIANAARKKAPGPQ